MVTANIETTSGTKVTVEGSKEDVLFLLNEVEDREAHRAERRERSAILNERRREGINLNKTSVLRNLLEQGFFDVPKKIRETGLMLKEMNISIPSSTLHPLLLRLVAFGELKRAINEEGVFEYSKVNKTSKGVS
jgi:hypothetical protein